MKRKRSHFSEVQKFILTVIKEKIEKNYFNKIINKFTVPSPNRSKDSLNDLINSGIVEESKGYLKIKNGFSESMYSSEFDEAVEMIENKILGLENDS